MKKVILFLCIALLIAGNAVAQEAAPAMFAVYEDHVNPAMNGNFRDALKKLKAACEQNKIDVRWTTVAYDDNSYTHLAPIKSFADMDKNAFAPLEAKMGKEAFASMWADLDKCIVSRDSRVVVRMDNLSYLTPPAGENYRDIFFWSVTPGKEAEAEPAIMEYKKLNESRKTENGFITYKVVFGGDNMYAFVFWGKNLVDRATKGQKAGELLGEEGSKHWSKTLSITKTRYTKRGWVETDLSYAPPAAVASK